MAKYKKVSRGVFDKFDSDYNNGVLTIRLKSWNEFHGVVEKFNDFDDYIWRGQPKEQLLKSKIDRVPSDKPGRQKKLGVILSKLKETLNKHRSIREFEENEIWAIGQHYGLNTPLLDWTVSPYIASYFAFYEKSENDDASAIIYTLNRALKLLMNGKKHRFVEFDLNDSKFDHPQNLRLLNQRGKFTKALEGEDIESVLASFWAISQKKQAYLDEIILAKILIPSKFKNECLKSLKFMNITYEVLFPDYAEDVRECKENLKQYDFTSQRIK